MPNSKDKLPSYVSILIRHLQSAAGPVPVVDLIDGMLAEHPSSAKNPRKTMRTYVSSADGRHLVFLDKDTVLSLRLAWHGARFRLPLSPEIIRRGRLNIEQILRPYLTPTFDMSQVSFIDAAGQPIAHELLSENQEEASPFGRMTITAHSANLAAWLRANQVGPKDEILFTVADWEKGIFQLELEREAQHDLALRVARDAALADLFYEQLEHAHMVNSIFTWEAAPTAYARLPDKSGYPPDHWMVALAADGRLRTDAYSIRYSDSPLTLFEKMLGEPVAQAAFGEPRPLSKAERTQVYRFKAALLHRPGIWRTIEIQGKQSLAHFDRMLRDAFQHDDSDHLSGFWHLVPRGANAQPGAKSKAGRPGRFREVDLATVNPMGEGEGADAKIAELEFAVGDQLKYVYDFGESIEHRLTLEAIEAPARHAKYPREVARNQPQYFYCVECQELGRQTVATWMCLESTTEHGDEVLICDACAQERHEDHYMEEISY